MQHSAQVIIQDLSAVPRELIAAAGITENLIASTMHSTTAEGTSGVGGTTYLGVKAPVYLAGEFRMGDEESSTPLHEYSHRWHIKACGDNITNDPQFTALNPRRGFEYGNEINGPYTAAEKAATVSQYSTSSLAEDFAETASAGIRTNFSYTGKPIVGQKQFVTMARINQIAPGAGSYLIAYSQAQDRTTGLEMPPFIPARAPE